MRRVALITAVLFLILTIITVAACNGRESLFFLQQNKAPEFVFRYAENQAADYPTTLGAYRFAELVRERTEGRIEIVVYHSAQLGSETKVVEQMRFGGIDFARVSISILAEFAPGLNALQLPYLYQSDAHMWEVLDGQIGDHCLGFLEEQGLIGLSWYNAGSRSFYTRVPINSLEELRGLNIRIQESAAMMADMIRLLGANPVQMVFSEVYSGLRMGRVDGAENNWPSYESTSHYEVARYFYADEHTRVPEMQLISKTSMEKLSEEDQRILFECARESALYEREEWSKRELSSEEYVRNYGVEVVIPSDEEKRKLQDLCKPLYEKYAADYMDIVEQILEKTK